MNTLEEIESLIRQRSEALIRKDIAELQTLLADRFRYTNAQGVLFDKKEYLDTYVTSGLMQWQSQEIDELSIDVYGEVAIAYFRVHDVATYQGQPFDAFFRSSITCVRFPDGWKCVSAHTSSIPSERNVL